MKLALFLSFFGCSLTLLAQATSPSKLNYNRLGYYRVGAVSPEVVIANPTQNAQKIIAEMQLAFQNHTALLVFPELALTGYTAEDLFLTNDLLQNTKSALYKILRATYDLVNLTVVVGAPYRTSDGRLYNVAFVINGGKIIGAVPKTHLPNYNEFYEKRWFVSGQDVEQTVNDPELGPFHLGTQQLFQIGEMLMAVEICEDAWAPISPSAYATLAGANVIVNLSASNAKVGKADVRRDLIKTKSEHLIVGYIYAASGPSESTKDLVFDGHSLIYETGSLLAESQRFQLQGERTYADLDLQKILHERQLNLTLGSQKLASIYRTHIIKEYPTLPSLHRQYPSSNFIPGDGILLNQRSREIIEIQATGLARRLQSAKVQSVVIGVSGGLDSTLALLVANHAIAKLNWSPQQIIGVTMPGFGTSNQTKSSAHLLMDALNITQKEIPIAAAVTQHFKDIGHDPQQEDVTFENAQARERTQILFDLANKHNGLVLGTGDLSELCLGWCTFNGDHMANYNVNASIPKTLAHHLVNWYANTLATPELKLVLTKILTTAYSPELKSTSASGAIQQITEDEVGPYRLHDFFIFHFLRNGFSVEKIYYLALNAFGEEYAPATILRWLKVFVQRFYTQQFKRSVVPAGPKVGSVSVSPRGDWRMPDEASCEELLKNIAALKK